MNTEIDALAAVNEALDRLDHSLLSEKMALRVVAFECPNVMVFVFNPSVAEMIDLLLRLLFSDHLATGFRQLPRSVFRRREGWCDHQPSLLQILLAPPLRFRQWNSDFENPRIVPTHHHYN